MELVRAIFATSMLVTDVGHEMFWWQLWDVGDGFGHFRHQHLLFFNIMLFVIYRRVPTSKNVTNIEIPSPTSENCHQDKVTNIQLSPTWIHKHSVVTNIQLSATSRVIMMLMTTLSWSKFNVRHQHWYNRNDADFFSVSDYKYDDESDYGNGMYTPTFDTGSSSSHLVHDQGKPKPYLNFINSV